MRQCSEFKSLSNPKPIRLIDYSHQLLFLLTLISIFIPLSPKMPASGLDASWALALNQALAQGLEFGKTIIFTLGPYSSIYTKAYHPSTDFMIILSSCYLTFFYGLAIIALMKKRRWAWIMIIFFSTMIYSRDSLLFSYPLLVGLLSYRHLYLDEKPQIRLIGLLFTPFGLLVLVKGSLLIACMMTAFLCLAFFLWHRQAWAAALCSISFIVSIELFWLAAGQPFVNLPNYLWQTLSLAADFSEAMALDGKSEEIIAYLFCALIFFAVLISQRQNSLDAKLFLLGLFFIFLFISFKAGFTRHFGHSFIPATSILFATLLFTFINKGKRTWPLVILAFCCWTFIIGQHTKISLRHNLLSTYAPAWQGLKKRLLEKDGLKQGFTIATAFLHNQISFPLLEGTTDIYSYQQAFLIASKNSWSPRPIFQSYSVFNSQLAKKNRAHLSGPNKPDNIIFRLETIDNRIPSLDDGSSWPLLIRHYEPNQTVEDFLVLKRRDKDLIKKSGLVDLATETHYLGEDIDLSRFDGMIFVKIDIKPRLWGKLATLLLKPSPLSISLTLRDGRQLHYRLIASMAKSGFLLSPLIENTAEFSLLYGQKNALDKNKIKLFRIETKEGTLAQWQQLYTVYFKRIEDFA